MESLNQDSQWTEHDSNRARLDHNSEVLSVSRGKLAAINVGQLPRIGRNTTGNQGHAAKLLSRMLLAASDRAA
jgi:hypothetical protein